MRCLIISLLIVTQCLTVELSVCGLFSDNMVLQDGKESQIWGQAKANAEISFSIGDKSWKATANKNGDWSSKIPALASGKSYHLNIESGKTITIKNIVIGEVWIAGGQSNMQWSIARSSFKNEAKTLCKQTAANIRWIKIPYRVSRKPLSDVNAQWSIVDEGNLDGMSAVAFNYAAHLQQRLGKPVGIIQCCIGGTVAESWMSEQALQRDIYKPLHNGWKKLIEEWYPGIDPKKVYAEKCKQWPIEQKKALAAGKEPPPWPSMPKGPDHKNRLNALYNGMLYGISPYTIKGVIWYQGESNAYRAIQYRDLLVDLIKDWRRHWGQDMPFYMVELCSYQELQKGPVDRHVYPVAREAQMLAAKQLEHCDLISCIDLYDKNNPKDIHPKNKRDVGKRLADLALNQQYQLAVAYSGPRLLKHEIKNNSIVLHMEFAENMHAVDNGAIKGFAIAGTDKKWHWAEAQIEGKTIILQSKQVEKPVAAAYGWAGVPNGNLVNGNKLPAFGFRTDDWPRSTHKSVNP